MSENCTAEDFAQATFARHGDGGRAARFAGDKWPWRASTADAVPWLSDEEMARDGWVPVVESRITEDTLRHVEERAERKRQKLIAHIESVEAAVRDRNRTIEELYVARQEASRRESAAHDRVVTLLDTKKAHERTICELRHDLAVAREELVDLRWENRRLEAGAEGVVSLGGLKAAWEAAEVPTDGAPIRSGDVVIEKISAGAYAVMSPPPTCGLVGREFRVLSRAPREPWQDLADLLRAWDAEPADADADGMAKWLHERGVRVTGGEES